MAALPGVALGVLLIVGLPEVLRAEVFRALGEEPARKPCEGMKGLLEEGEEFIDADGDKDAIDAALIGAAQKVEHYEIATYGTLRTFALTLGRRDEARAMFERVLAARNHVGLLSEDVDPKTNELWGNFPQTYSMVGLIVSAMRLSKSWEEAFWRGS